MIKNTFKFVVVTLFAAGTISAADRKEPNYFQNDFPFQGAAVSVKSPDRNVAMKGLAIRVGNGATMLFDPELLRMAAGWNGGFITGEGVVYDGGHGKHPAADGDQKFGTAPIPGWGTAANGFSDERAEKPYGPLAPTVGAWTGLYPHGDNVVLSYSVFGVPVVEQPGSVSADGEIAFTRTFNIDSMLKEDLLLNVCVVPHSVDEKINDHHLVLTRDQSVTQIGIVGADKAAKLGVQEGGQAVLRLAKGTKPGMFKVVIWNGTGDSQGKFASLLKGEPTMVDFKKGGPRHWPEAVVVQGKLDTSETLDGAYVTDMITAPVPNPWNRRVRFGGLDFFSDGKRAALCTHEGDVWIVSGIDDTLENLVWTRFASGQYETLGLEIVDDVIYTSGRDQITRYHDLNDDGEADFYENFNNDFTSSRGFHEFVFDLQTDDAGNFYFAKAGPVRSGGGGFGDPEGKIPGNGEITSYNGKLMKLSPDGKKLEIMAEGFRAPNGIGVRGDGQVTTSDNEGTWVPTTPINWVEPGGFYGVTLLEGKYRKEPLKAFNPPLCWLAKNFDNSGGGQIWVPSSEWGPLAGELLHMSYGQSSLYLVMKEKVGRDGIAMQGGVVKIPVKFTSSAMRARFNPRDHQLYIAGLREWQSNAAREAGFDRIRYTGKKFYSANGLKVVPGGVAITFTEPLDREVAEDVGNYGGKRWNYNRSENYGSDELNVTDPAIKGRESIEITSAKLSEDGKTVTLQIEDFKPVMQQTIQFLLDSEDGEIIEQEIMHTVHHIPAN